MRDLDEAKEAFAGGARGNGQWSDRDDLDGQDAGWPANIIACTSGSSYAVVAYDMTLPNEPWTGR